MQLILAQVQVQPEAYTLVQNIADKFGFPALLVLILMAAGFFIIYKFGGRVTDFIIEILKKIHESNNKNAEAIEKILELVEVFIKQSEITDKRIENIEKKLNSIDYNNKRQTNLIRKVIIALKDLVAKDKQHIKDLLNEALNDVKDIH